VQVAVLVALSAGVGLHPVGWAAGAVYGTLALVLLGFALRHSWPRSIGHANRVTLVRAVLVGGVTALVADSLVDRIPTAVIVSIAAVALVLDGVDGIVARRTGSVTEVGARFDMEVDAFLILVLSVFVAQSLGWWVLTIGLLRYVFWVAGKLAPWLRAALPASQARKVVAATEGVVLVVASSGALPAADVVVGVALALLVWSFGRDVVWLWHARTPVRVGVSDGKSGQSRWVGGADRRTP
jgi:phosphatidylglycerophosphate synthase